MPALRVYGIPQVNAQLLSHVDKLEKKKKKERRKKRHFLSSGIHLYSMVIDI